MSEILQTRTLKIGEGWHEPVRNEHKDQTDFYHPKLDVECTVHKDDKGKWHSSVNHSPCLGEYLDKNFDTRDEAISGIIRELVNRWHEAQKSEIKLHTIRESLNI